MGSVWTVCEHPRQQSGGLDKWNGRGSRWAAGWRTCAFRARKDPPRCGAAWSGQCQAPLACGRGKSALLRSVPILVSDIVMETDDLPRQAQAKHENTVGGWEIKRRGRFCPVRTKLPPTRCSASRALPRSDSGFQSARHGGHLWITVRASTHVSNSQTTSSFQAKSGRVKARTKDRAAGGCPDQSREAHPFWLLVGAWWLLHVAVRAEDRADRTVLPRGIRHQEVTEASRVGRVPIRTHTNESTHALSAQLDLAALEVTRRVDRLAGGGGQTSTGCASQVGEAKEEEGFACLLACLHRAARVHHL